MRIGVIGGGPAGLYFALLAKKTLPKLELTVYEQSGRDTTYGFGIILAERGLERFRKADSRSHDAIVAGSYVTRHRSIRLNGESLFIEGGWGGAISRLRLLTILRDCCEEAGVTLKFGERVVSPKEMDVDLVVGADGVNSAVRSGLSEEFGTSTWMLGNKLAWYGTTCHFPSPILSFKRTADGHFWCAAYPYSETMSTFVAECDAATWRSSGFSELSDDARRHRTEEIFAEELQGKPLISNKSNWHSLPVTRNREWSVGTVVLLGDALHSAHPTIGSGTRIAMEDSIALVHALSSEQNDIPGALKLFRLLREPQKQKLVTAAEKSFNWYEEVGSRIDSLPLEQFTFDFLTRTGRIDETRLWQDHPALMRRYEAQWKMFAKQKGWTSMTSVG